MATPFQGSLNPRNLVRSVAVVGALLISSSGCATGGGGSASDGIGNAIVVEDESFESSRGSVISILQNHVRGMSVASTENCPHIVLRGGMGRSQLAEALVYLDGQRMSDTCVLESLNIESISWVEVYPSGVTQRAGYSSNAGGLILVFTKNGPEDRKRGL